eukprot:CAMPEP_0183442384 /NCGR_PEP_ID=MMETSP0370-20130417/88082_1 /TAXON_ID=268820 /ORGANISM="Peridinium aciculiferum, Strain PAER-2" /LENGTH=68 /DNA_ID=CAMNT_0025631979 /DNA_START=24 /DNA_END=230 /DNA_ORIENTATION=+
MTSQKPLHGNSSESVGSTGSTAASTVATDRSLSLPPKLGLDRAQERRISRQQTATLCIEKSEGSRGFC